MKKQRTKIIDTTLFVRDTAGEYHIAPLPLVIETARRGLDEKARVEAFTSPARAMEWCIIRLSPLEHEVFAGVFLDNQHKVIEFTELFRGTIDSAAVHPREVVKATLACNAAAVMFAHNHPSGLPVPSEADQRITQRLKWALELIDVRVLDHIVVGGGQAYSFAEHGLLLGGTTSLAGGWR
jgi:DNA repair protein RadC